MDPSRTRCWWRQHRGPCVSYGDRLLGERDQGQRGRARTSPVSSVRAAWQQLRHQDGCKRDLDQGVAGDRRHRPDGRTPCRGRPRSRDAIGGSGPRIVKQQRGSGTGRRGDRLEHQVSGPGRRGNDHQLVRGDQRSERRAPRALRVLGPSAHRERHERQQLELDTDRQIGPVLRLAIPRGIQIPMELRRRHGTHPHRHRDPRLQRAGNVPGVRDGHRAGRRRRNIRCPGRGDRPTDPSKAVGHPTSYDQQGRVEEQPAE